MCVLIATAATIIQQTCPSVPGWSDMSLFDPFRVDPLDVARHDYMEFYIKTILKHRGDLQRKTSLDFLLK